jgi:hypothetical protein
MNHGLIKQPLHASQYIAGWITAIPDTILNESGDWREFAPKYEPQSSPGEFDSMSCVTFSALNTLEILHKFHYNHEVNLSDRFTAKMSGTSPNGNYFTRVWDSIRHDGVVSEEFWPFEGDTWNEYMADISQDVKDEAQKQSEDYFFGYEFLPRYWDKQTNFTITSDEALREGLKRGPLQVSIGDDTTGVSYHALTLLYLDDDGSRHMFDHYGNGFTVLPESRNIYAALRSHLTTNKPNMVLLPTNCLVFEGEKNGSYGLHINGKLYVDDLAKIQSQWIMRNEENGFFKKGPVRTISLNQWEELPKFNLKNEPL